MKENLLALSFAILFATSIHAQDTIESCYTIKTIMKHDAEYNKSAWQKAAILIKELVHYHKVVETKENNAENFCKDLATTGLTIKTLAELAKENSFYLNISAVNKEELPLDEHSQGEDEVIEISYIFKLDSSLEEKDKIDTLMIRYSELCNTNSSEALDSWSFVTQALVNAAPGTAHLHISLFENKQ